MVLECDAEEKTCYVALSPAKEEKEAQAGARGEEFRLPDGNVIRVSLISFISTLETLELILSFVVLDSAGT
jgi:hypothetical protein